MIARRVPLHLDSPDVYSTAMAEFEASLRAADVFEQLLLDAYFRGMEDALERKQKEDQ